LKRSRFRVESKFDALVPFIFVAVSQVQRGTDNFYRGWNENKEVGCKVKIVDKKDSRGMQSTKVEIQRGNIILPVGTINQTTLAGGSPTYPKLEENT